MNILMIGGTGFTGPQIVTRLVGLGHKVTVFHRGKTKGNLPPEVNHIYGDRDDLVSFREQFQELQLDIAIDMILRTEDEAKETLKTLEGIVPRVIVISSQDVYRAFGLICRNEDGPLLDGPITEESPLRTSRYPHRGSSQSAAAYDYDKILVEEVIKSSTKIASTILRFPAVNGPGDPQHRFYPYLKRMKDKRPYILLSESMSQWRWTRGYVENVAEGTVAAIINPVSADKVYNIGEEQALTMKEWIQKIAFQAGWDGQIIVLPDHLVPEAMTDGLRYEQHSNVDTSKLRKELGFSDQVSFEKGLEATIAWELENLPVNVDPQMFDYEAEAKLLDKIGYGFTGGVQNEKWGIYD